MNVAAQLTELSKKENAGSLIVKGSGLEMMKGIRRGARLAASAKSKIAYSMAITAALVTGTAQALPYYIGISNETSPWQKVLYSQLSSQHLLATSWKAFEGFMKMQKSTLESGVNSTMDQAVAFSNRLGINPNSHYFDVIHEYAENKKLLIESHMCSVHDALREGYVQYFNNPNPGDAAQILNYTGQAVNIIGAVVSSANAGISGQMQVLLETLAENVHMI